ncbi:IclR family transcriptional regulator C-terminal domain-containing protein [Egicoccus sp. AB-alg6-2]|uniref:IclR family transcriptional regulator domain-containing protein n=1 Tax=Egicoccus sp. AB-alg6-2 TaxID=3242692 RepID=UPI00359CFC1A
MTDSVRAFERGLRVIRSFTADTSLQTLADVARATDLNRATARRFLLTLEELGYVRRVGDLFTLTPRVLDLGYAYVSSFGVPQLAQPYLEQLSEQLHEAASVGVLDGAEVVYVARVPAKRVMTVSIGLGTRFPAYRTSLGRALLAWLPDDEVERLWDVSDKQQPTSRTVADLDSLRQRLRAVRRLGYALVDQELEIGVRSVAAPVRDATGRPVAAINLSTHVSRTTKQDLQQRFAPALLRTAGQIEHALSSRPS